VPAGVAPSGAVASGTGLGEDSFVRVRAPRRGPCWADAAARAAAPAWAVAAAGPIRLLAACSFSKCIFFLI
jgi:hypothetical protein